MIFYLTNVGKWSLISHLNIPGMISEEVSLVRTWSRSVEDFGVTLVVRFTIE